MAADFQKNYRLWPSTMKNFIDYRLSACVCESQSAKNPESRRLGASFFVVDGRRMSFLAISLLFLRCYAVYTVKCDTQAQSGRVAGSSRRFFGVGNAFIPWRLKAEPSPLKTRNTRYAIFEHRKTAHAGRFSFYFFLWFVIPYESYA